MYLVRTQFRAPPEMDKAQLAALTKQEAETARSLQDSGVLARLWREVSTTCAWGLWMVDDETELQDFMGQLPCYPFMEVESHRLTRHPNSIGPRIGKAN
jgi:muconolactone delta-isomerase